MTNNQKEALVVVGTVLITGALAYTAGKLSAKLSGYMMTRNFNKAVDAKASAEK